MMAYSILTGEAQGIVVGSGSKAEKRPLHAIFGLRIVWEIAGCSNDSFQGLASPKASWVLDC